MKKRSICLYTQGKLGIEYGVREDMKVFYKEKFWNGRFYTATKWKQCSDELAKKFWGLPQTIIIGEAPNGHHIRVDSTRLKLPQVKSMF